MTDTRTLALSVLLPGFVGSSVPAWVRERLDEGLAGVLLFGQNVETDEQLRSLTGELHELRPEVLVASDEEGGSVTRLDARTGSPWPGHATLGALDDERATYDVAAGLGRRARSAGVDLVLAPVLDVGSEPDNPVIGVRSFGPTADLVARHGSAFVRGLQDAGVAACAKHYPGHGATRTDSHLDLPVLDVDEHTWRERDLAPFSAAVAAGVCAVMTAHVVVRSVDHRPATMSPVLLRMLRRELGFDGVVVSDALDMKAVSARVGRTAGAVRALSAGVDLLCVGNPAFPEPYDDESAVEEVVDAVQAAVADGSLPVGRLEDAARRVRTLAAAAQAPTEMPPDAALTLGRSVARRALRVRGDVRLPEKAVVVVPAPKLGYAAGRNPSALVEVLRDRRPHWPVHEVCGVDQVRPVVDGADAVLLVVEGRHDPANDALVRSVLEARPDSVVVYGGVPRPGDSGTRTVHTHGTGAATATAVAGLLLEEGTR